MLLICHWLVIHRSWRRGTLANSFINTRTRREAVNKKKKKKRRRDLSTLVSVIFQSSIDNQSAQKEELKSKKKKKKKFLRWSTENVITVAEMNFTCSSCKYFNSRRGRRLVSAGLYPFVCWSFPPTNTLQVLQLINAERRRRITERSLSNMQQQQQHERWSRIMRNLVQPTQHLDWYCT